MSNNTGGATIPSGVVCGPPGGATLGSGNWILSGNTTFQGPISISNGANVTFGAGTYTFNGLQIADNNVTLNGDPSGVTLYNASNTLTICAAPTVPTNATGCPGNYSNDTINLTAPTSGTYAGILFYQDRSDSNPAIIMGSDSNGVGNTFLEGALYFPDAQLTFGEVTDGTNWQNTYTILDANSLLLVGTINIGSTYPSTLPRVFTIRQPVLVE
jgi:autotransporter-associated beta strand protein